MNAKQSRSEVEKELNNLRQEENILNKAKGLFAEKRVEIILYSFIAMVLIAAVAAWIGQIIK